MISIKQFRRSLSHAIRGLKNVARHEQSFRLQLAGLIVVVILIFLLDLATWEQVILILLSASVLI